MNVTSRRTSTPPHPLDPLEEALQRFSIDATTPYLFLMSGLPGSGKTTLANQLSTHYRALLLSLDEFLVSLYGPSHIVDAPDERLNRVNAIRDPLWAIARRALSLNLSVVLDDGFFTSRSRARAFASCIRGEEGVISIKPIIVYCDAPVNVLEERLAARSRQGAPFSHHISPQLLASFGDRFEPPRPEEGMEILKVSSSSNNKTEQPQCPGDQK